jgi:hypothetical protein
MNYKETDNLAANFHSFNVTYNTWGCSALNGGMPTMSSKRMTPTDHQSALQPRRIYIMID